MWIRLIVTWNTWKLFFRSWRLHPYRPNFSGRVALGGSRFDSTSLFDVQLHIQLVRTTLSSWLKHAVVVYFIQRSPYSSPTTLFVTKAIHQGAFFIKLMINWRKTLHLRLFTSTVTLRVQIALLFDFFCPQICQQLIHPQFGKDRVHFILQSSLLLTAGINDSKWQMEW